MSSSDSEDDDYPDTYSSYSEFDDDENRFKAVILIIGETGAGKSTLINLIAGKPIADPESARTQEYVCTYEDKDTHLIWKLHLLNTPGFDSDTNTLNDHLNIMEPKLRFNQFSNCVNGIVYCHNIKLHPPILSDVGSRLTRIRAKFGERRFQEVEKYFSGWSEYYGAHLALHDNTRNSVEETLGLIIGKETAKLILLKELVRPQMMFGGKAAFKQNHEGIEQLMPEIRIMRMKEVADRAKIKGESRWQQKFAQLGLKLLKRALPGDIIGIEAQKQASMRSQSVVLSGTHNSRLDDANDKYSDDFIPLQIKPFTGKYAITPELASKKFHVVDVELLLVALNKIFYTIIPISYPGIKETLEYLINKGHDLGTIYGHVRVIWPTLSMLIPTDNNSDHVFGSVHVIGCPELTLRRCRDVDELLSLLNMYFDTKIPRFKLGVAEILKYLVDQGYEFGDVCVYMHYVWPRTPALERMWLRIWEPESWALKIIDVWQNFLTLERRGEEYEDQRQKSLRDDTIHELDLIKPRRIWDLYAHRVIPIQFSAIGADYKSHISFTPRYHPVSHSWTEEMSPVDTPVNAYEWPVPLPPGVTLEAVRNELLNLGAQYVWLDVVCLRQESSDSAHEDLRMKEWRIDVPTIGKVYQASPSVDNVIRYLNGLGKVFRRYGWHDKRHWSQRAWTLQEVNGEYIEAGLPEGVKDILDETDDNGTKLRDHLHTREIKLPFQLGKGFGRTDLHDVISAMQGRYSQNPVDKIFGLSALLECSVLLAYSENEQEEDAWARLVRRVSLRIRAELLFAYPLPGENGCYWRPSWRQLMAGTRVIEKVPSFPLAWSELIGDVHLSCRMALIKGCQVSLDCPSATAMIKTERKGKKYEWRMINLNPHAQDIVPEVFYTLAGHYARPSLHWVLCKPYLHGGLEKISVLRRSSDEIQGSDIIGIGLDILWANPWPDLICSEFVVFH